MEIANGVFAGPNGGGKAIVAGPNGDGGMRWTPLINVGPGSLDRER